MGEGEGVTMEAEWSDIECSGWEGPCDATPTKHWPCRTMYDWPWPERSAALQAELKTLAADDPRREEVQRLLVECDARMEEGDPNHGLQLCAECGAAYMAHWDATWEDYYHSTG